MMKHEYLNRRSSTRALSRRHAENATERSGTRIPYADLVAKIQEGTVSEDELAACFVLDEAASEPFKPALALNETTVDITGVEMAAKGSASLLGLDAARLLNGIRSARPESRAAGAVTILAEGDSWFNLPFLYPKTLIDILSRSTPVDNIAHWGDGLEQMIGEGEYLPYLANGDVDFFLFSGAGNDVLGGGTLYRFLRLYDIDHQHPSDAEYYPTQEFYDALDRIERLYRQLAKSVLKISPATRLILHGYDCAIPQGNGPFLGRAMERQGLDPVFKPDLCRAIIRFMVEKFNQRLDRLSREFSHVTHVNFVGTLGRNDWFDELHPRESGAVKLARKVALTLGLGLNLETIREPRRGGRATVEVAEDAASARRLGLLDDEDELAVARETAQVPFDLLDAFERLSEIAPDVADEPVAVGEGLEASAEPDIRFGPNAKSADVTEFSRGVLRDIMRRAGLSRVTVSSTSRSPAEQARVMFNNLERFGVAHQRALYGPAGDLVIEVYRKAKQAGRGAPAIKALMTDEIVRVGPNRVSRHAADPKVLNVLDIAPSSVSLRQEFEHAVPTRTHG